MGESRRSARDALSGQVSPRPRCAVFSGNLGVFAIGLAGAGVSHLGDDRYQVMPMSNSARAAAVEEVALFLSAASAARRRCPGLARRNYPIVIIRPFLKLFGKRNLGDKAPRMMVSGELFKVRF